MSDTLAGLLDEAGYMIRPTQAELWRVKHDDLKQKYLDQQRELEWVITKLNGLTAYYEPYAPLYVIGELFELESMESSDE